MCLLRTGVHEGCEDGRKINPNGALPTVRKFVRKYSSLLVRSTKHYTPTIPLRHYSINSLTK